jgi:hypothetical protein
MDKNRLNGLLFAILGDDDLVERWWSRPNAWLDEKTPEELFKTDPERVRDHIFSFVYF